MRFPPLISTKTKVPAREWLLYHSVTPLNVFALHQFGQDWRPGPTFIRAVITEPLNRPPSRRQKYQRRLGQRSVDTHQDEFEC